MTEAEWLACADDPTPMLEFLQGKASARKLRLCAVACCRRVWSLLAGGVGRDAVEAAERFADGGATPDELAAAHRAATVPGDWGLFQLYPDEMAPSAAHAAAAPPAMLDLARVETLVALARDNSKPPDHNGGGRESNEIHADFIRDIFGNPFRPTPVLAPSWRTPTAVALARGMYGSRDFSAMPILADALQDAGCDDADILDHCRGPGPHVRGCWVVDLVLGKE